MTARGVRPALAVTAAVATVAACGAGPNLMPRTTTGATGRQTVVLMAAQARPAVMATITDFAATRRTEVVSAQGTPEAVIDSVKQGAVVDAVVLPAGAQLDRVRDELLAPPERVGRAGGVTWYVATVTGKGLPYARYLASPRGRAALARHGVVP